MAEKEPTGRQLTRRQFDEVIRRASELAAGESDPGEGDLPEGEIYRIAREVGLGERHVRRALDEVRSEVRTGSFADRLIGPGVVRASRVVDQSCDELSRSVDEFLVGGRLLQRVRRSPHFLQYRPSVDWVSQLARAASGTSRKYYVAAARSVEVTLEPIDDESTVVELEVDPGVRGDYVGAALAGGGFASLGGGVGAAILAATVVPDFAAVTAGIAVGVGVFASAVALTRRSYRRKFGDVRDEVEGVLDRLEMGESLEPPPSAWRSWVEKHFHGARRLLTTHDDGDPVG